MSEALQPCPWCDYPAQARSQLGFDHSPDEKRVMKYYVKCSTDDCVVAPMTTWFNTAEEAAEAWNRRAPVVGDEARDAARWRAMSKRMVGIDFFYEGTHRDIVAAIIELPDGERYPANANLVADKLVALDNQSDPAAPEAL